MYSRINKSHVAIPSYQVYRTTLIYETLPVCNISLSSSTTAYMLLSSTV